MVNGSPMIAAVYIVGGLVGLAWSANWFVSGSAALARALGVPVLLVGVVVVGFGTSAPELLVSANAAWQDNAGLAIGNAIGSNIANVALVLGMAALVAPVSIHSRILRQEVPLALVSMLVVGVFLYNLQIDRLEGVLLVCFLALFLALLVVRGRRQRPDAYSAELAHAIPAPGSAGRAAARTTAGLIVLLLSSRVLVEGAVAVAQAFRVSDLVIGLTVVAVGTSLPEAAAALASARRNEPDLAIGNVLGSNTFNMFGVIGVCGIIHPSQVDPNAVHRDWPVMVAVFLVFAALAWSRRSIGRRHGAFFLAGYAAYLAWVISARL